MRRGNGGGESGERRICERCGELWTTLLLLAVCRSDGTDGRNVMRDW